MNLLPADPDPQAIAPAARTVRIVAAAAIAQRWPAEERAR